MMPRISTAALALVLAACGGAGLGDDVRRDVTARIATIEAPVAACYESALKVDRKLRGRMFVSFEAEPKTGKFTGARIERSDLRDPELEQCVTAEVEKLALEKPQKTVVSVSYPLDFAPTN